MVVADIGLLVNVPSFLLFWVRVIVGLRDHGMLTVEGGRGFEAVSVAAGG